MDDIRKMLEGPSHQRNDLTYQLESRNEYLRDQSGDFKNVRCGRKVVSFYETHATPSLQKVGRQETTLQPLLMTCCQQNPATDGWERSGPFITVANKDTSLLQLDDISEEKVSVDADHSKMVKFESKNDPAYETAVTYLEKFEAVAEKEVLSRFGMWA